MSEHHLHLHPDTTHPAPGHLQRSVGFYGLMFVSLGSIIGSGWLLGALNAAEVAGPASIISWILAAAMLTMLALVYAELGATYPVAGGSGPVPVLLARPARRLRRRLVVLAAGRRHRADRDPGRDHLRQQHQAGQRELPDAARDGAKAGLLNGRGLVVAVLLMILFTGDEPGRRQVHVREQLHRRDLEDGRARCWPSSSSPSLSLPPRQLHAPAAASRRTASTASSRPSRPAWCSPCRASSRPCSWPARPRNPQARTSPGRSSPRWRSAPCSTPLLQVAFIAGVDPADVAKNWDRPARQRPVRLRRLVHPGPRRRRRLAGHRPDHRRRDLARRAPASSTSARPPGSPTPSARRREMPGALSQHQRTRRPGRLDPGGLRSSAWSCFGPFPSWNKLVGVVTGATADHVRLRAGLAGVAAQGATATDRAPTGCRCRRSCCRSAFVSANLILYWGGYDYTWKIAVALVVGLVLFGIGARSSGHRRDAACCAAGGLDRPLDPRLGHHRSGRAVRRRQQELAAGVDRPAGRHRVQPGDLLLGGPGARCRGTRCRWPSPRTPTRSTTRPSPRAQRSENGGYRSVTSRNA